MSLSSKEYIRQSFDKAANTYSEFSKLQEDIAKKLTRIINNNYYENVLEIGFGDGKISNFLNFDYLNYIGIDLSFSMTKIFKINNLGKMPVVGDAEKSIFKLKTFDLIISSSTFQWFLNPNKTIKDILNLLTNKGEIYFSVFLKGTFWQMHELSLKTGFGSVLDLKDKYFYEGLGFKCFEKEYVLYFPNVVEFLKSHKKSGARFTQKHSLSGKTRFFHFCDLYEQLFGTQKGIEVTYKVGFCWQN